MAEEPEYKDRQAKASETLFKLLKSEPDDETDSRTDEVLPVPGEIYQSTYAKALAERKSSSRNLFDQYCGFPVPAAMANDLNFKQQYLPIPSSDVISSEWQEFLNRDSIYLVFS